MALLATSCETSEPTLGGVDSSEGLYVSISIEQPETRVGVDGKSVDWETGDKMMFYNSSSYVGDSSTWTDLEAEIDVEGKAIFEGTISSSLIGAQVSGFYPSSISMNYTSSNLLSAMNIVQPTYFKYNYDADSNLSPKSVGEYTYIHFISDEVVSEDNTSLKGSAKHLMAFVDLDLKDIAQGKEVERVYVSTTEIDSNYYNGTTYGSASASTTSLYLDGQALSLAADGTATVNNYIPNVTMAAGKNNGGTINYFLYMSTFVFELYDENGELGVAPNESGVLPLRLPIIPQSFSNRDWILYVCYTDGSESVVTKSVSATLEAGKIFNYDNPISLSGATELAAGSVTPKVGDYYYADGTYSPTLMSGGSDPIGIVYDLNKDGANTTVAKILNFYSYSGEMLLSDYCTDGYNYSTGFGTTQTCDGLYEMQFYLDKLCAVSSDSNAALNAHTTNAENDTYGELFAGISPLYAAVAALTPDTFYNAPYVASGFTHWTKGAGTGSSGIWYLPTQNELYSLFYIYAAYQSHGSYLLSDKINALPDSMKSGLASNQELCPFLEDHETFYRSASLNGGQCFVFKVIDPWYASSTSFFGQSKDITWNVDTYCARPIMRIAYPSAN